MTAQNPAPRGEAEGVCDVKAMLSKGTSITCCKQGYLQAKINACILRKERKHQQLLILGIYSKFKKCTTLKHCCALK